jgi:hypothetical protein
MKVNQMPVSSLQAGLYEWTMISSSVSRSGHVIVRGPNAAPIGNYPFAAGTETWYWATTTGSGGTPTFTFTLVYERYPSDQALLAAVGQVVNNEQAAGTAAMVPNWQPGAPLPSSGDIVTLTDVSDGPGSYGQLYKHVSFFLPVGGSPVMPTWYTDIPGLYSVFGGSAQSVPIAEGITAKMSWVKSGNDGYPDPKKWLWYGRDPK